MHCQNTGSSALDVKFRRVVLSSNDTLFNDQFCDNNLCYAPQGNDFTIPVATDLGVGEISLLKSSFLFSNTNTSIYVRYYALDENLNVIDSVDFSLNISGVKSDHESYKLIFQ